MNASRSDGVLHCLRRWAGIAWLGCAALAVPGVVAQGLAQGVAAPQPMLVVEQGSHSAPVRRIDVNLARGLVVTASDDRTARLWDAASGELRHILRPLAFGAEGGRLYGAAIHPERPLVAVGGTTGGDGRPHRIYLFDTESGALQRTVDARAGDVRKLVWSRDGSLLLAGYAGASGGANGTASGVRAFSADGRLVFEDATEGPVFGLAVSSTGLLAAVSLSGELRTYRAAAGAVTALGKVALGQRRAAGVAFSPDGRTLAVAFAESSVQANGRESLHAPVETFDAETGRSTGQLPTVPVFGGDLRSVAWSPDGRWIYAAGTAYLTDRSFPIVQYEAAGRRVNAVISVASDSVTDLAALPSGAVAFGSFDGSWGLVDGGRVVQRNAASVSTVRGDAPADLALSADARSLRWGLQSARGGLGFQFERRRLAVAPASTPTLAPAQTASVALRAPETSFGIFDRPTDWNLSRGTPTVAGKRLVLGPDERSRALVVLRRTKSAVIGTNRALYKLDDQGTLLWRVAVDTEVRAVNASDDGRLVVTALADGTLRWWRAQDGALLLTLFAAASGQWVVWTPSGYYDASAGADRLVGWAVAKAGGATMDFYSLNRFRERFNRPDVIEAVLDSLDEPRALAALAERDLAARDQAAREAASREQAAVAAARAAAEVAEQARLAAAREAQARQGAERAEAERQSARLAAERAEAVRLATAAQLAAAQALLEAKVREELLAERRTQAVIKALELPPALSAPENKRIRLATSEVTLPFAVTSPGLATTLTVEVRVNGRPAQPSDLVLPKSLDGSSRGFARLAVAEGESLVEILARNPYGVSEPLSFKIERMLGAAIAAAPTAAPTAAAAVAVAGPEPPQRVTPASPPRPLGDLYVLAIGVSDYVRPEYRLGLAAKDALDFAAAMKQQEGKLYRKVIVRTLANREATRAAIAKEFDALRLAVGPADVAMLFMAGHGLNDPTGQYYFLPADGQHERLASTGLPQDAIVSTLSKIRGKTLLFLDTCFAGNSLGAMRQAGRKTEKMMNDLSSSENGVVVFASSTGQEESEEKAEWGNGAFTKALIDGLGGKADFTRAGRVTYAALNLFVSEEVVRLTDGRQRPVFISPRGIPDFALVRL